MGHKKKKSKKGTKSRRRRQSSSSSSQGDSDTVDQAWNYDLHELLTTDRFNRPQLVTTDFPAKSLTRQYIHEHGLKRPLFFATPEGLGMKVPPPNFTVDNVRRHVTGKRSVEVVNVASQSSNRMTMDDFVDYFKQPKNKRKELINVLSLEFSKTPLEKKITSPRVVRELDWCDQMWPKELKARQKSTLNDTKNMFYPKVQYYCLMSVQGCYTDFHVDFGGTSVWYHVLKGEKTFWLAEPTEQNLHQLEEWLLSGHQDNVFLGDLIQAHRVTLRAGNVFFIPSGWIHAVFTPQDSIVFGGNFLHQFAMPMQLRVNRMEDVTRVKSKFRYPFFVEMHWYVLNYYSVKFTETDYIKQVEVDEYEAPPQLERFDLAEPEDIAYAQEEPMPVNDNIVVEAEEHVPATIATFHEAEPLNGQGFLAPYQIDDINVEYERPTKWNEAFLLRLSELEMDGLKLVVEWMHDLIDQNRQAYPRGLTRPKTLLADIRAGISEAKSVKNGKNVFDLCPLEANLQRDKDIEHTITTVAHRGRDTINVKAMADSTTPDYKIVSTSTASDRNEPAPFFEIVPLGGQPIQTALRRQDNYRPSSSYVNRAHTQRPPMRPIHRHPPADLQWHNGQSLRQQRVPSPNPHPAHFGSQWRQLHRQRFDRPIHSQHSGHRSYSPHLYNHSPPQHQRFDISRQTQPQYIPQTNAYDPSRHHTLYNSNEIDVHRVPLKRPVNDMPIYQPPAAKCSIVKEEIYGKIKELIVISGDSRTTNTQTAPAHTIVGPRSMMHGSEMPSNALVRRIFVPTLSPSPHSSINTNQHVSNYPRSYQPPNIYVPPNVPYAQMQLTETYAAPPASYKELDRCEVKYEPGAATNYGGHEIHWPPYVPVKSVASYGESVRSTVKDECVAIKVNTLEEDERAVLDQLGDLTKELTALND